MSSIPTSWANGRTRHEKSFSADLQPVVATVLIHDGRSECACDIALISIAQTSFAGTSLVEVVWDDRIIHWYRRRSGGESIVRSPTSPIKILVDLRTILDVLTQPDKC